MSTAQLNLSCATHYEVLRFQNRHQAEINTTVSALCNMLLQLPSSPRKIRPQRGTRDLFITRSNPHPSPSNPPKSLEKSPSLLAQPGTQRRAEEAPGPPPEPRAAWRGLGKDHHAVPSHGVGVMRALRGPRSWKAEPKASEALDPPTPQNPGPHPGSAGLLIQNGPQRLSVQINDESGVSGRGFFISFAASPHFQTRTRSPNFSSGTVPPPYVLPPSGKGRLGKGTISAPHFVLPPRPEGWQGPPRLLRLFPVRGELRGDTCLGRLPAPCCPQPCGRGAAIWCIY